MELGICDYPTDNLWSHVDTFYLMGKKSDREHEFDRASFSLETYEEPSLDRNDSVSTYYVSCHILCHSNTLLSSSNALFLGGPWFVTIFQLPQRFQVVDGISALDAGFKLIPFTVLAPVGSVISAVLAGKVKVPPIYLVLIASCIQVIGFALLSTLPIAAAASSAQYGYQVIAGFGVGINISTLILMTPYSVADPRDKCEYPRDLFPGASTNTFSLKPSL